MRLIDANMAIVTLSHLMTGYNDEWDVTVRECIEAVKRLPEVKQPTGKWIPVSERMPEESGNYLVTVNVGPNTLVRTCHFLAEDGCFLALWASNPVAWMPLPKAYEVTE